MLYINRYMMSRTDNTSASFFYPEYVSKPDVIAIDFPQRLAELRNQHSLTQVQAGERVRAGDSRLQFEAISRFGEEEMSVIRSLIEGIILKHEACRWQNVSSHGGERK
jgi:hypothetical protein